MKTARFGAIILAMLLSAAALIWVAAAAGATNTGEASADNTVSSKPNYITQLFDQSKVTTIDIVIDEADWQALLANARNEEAYPAAIVVNNHKVSNVSIRAKGNSSLSSVAGSDSERYSFKVKMDAYVDGQTLFGLDTLNLNNNFSDASSMRELVSYQLLSELGAPTPACSYAFLNINGQPWGLYTMVEEVDDSFLKRNFGSADGQLFKPEGSGNDGSNLVYVDDNPNTYSGLYSPNRDITDLNNMIKMMKALSTGENIEQYLDVDSALNYIAATAAVASYDSYLGGMQHNYYLYDYKGKVYMIPWDYNMAFGGFGGFEARRIDGEAETQTETDGPQIYIDEPISGSTMENRPLVSALLANEQYLEQYHGILQQIVDEFYGENFETRVQELADLIRPYIETDPTAFYTAEQWESSLTEAVTDTEKDNTPQQGAQGVRGGLAMMGGSQTGLIPLANTLAENIRSQLAGETASTNNGNGLGGGGMGGRMIQVFDSQQMPQGADMPQGGNMLQGGNMPQGGERPQGGEMPQRGNMQQGQRNPMFQAELPEGADMAQVMDIISKADGQLTDEARQQLLDMGFSEDSIETLMQMKLPQGTDGADGMVLAIGGMNKRGNETRQTYTAADWMVLGVSAAFMAAAIVWVFCFRRRKKIAV